jgi:hypothetical protein
MNYSELYQIAIGVDSRIAQDAWSTAFVTGENSMVNQTAKWQESVSNYLSQSE